MITKKNGIEQLYMLSPNGKLELISPEKGKISHPVLSPNRSKVAFTHEGVGSMNIYIYDLATGETTQLTESNGIAAYPAWSREGNKIAYMMTDGNERNIFVSNIDGSETEQISTGRSFDNEPLWGHYNPSIVYFKAALGESESVNKYDVVIGQLSQITSGGSNEMLRQIPKHDQISFVQRVPGRNALWTYDEVSGEKHSILETPGNISSYAWSPDGKSLAMTINSNLEIYKYDRDNGLMFAFTIEHAAYPAWSKSGQELYYNKRIPDSHLQIFKFDLKTSIETQVTDQDFDCTDAMPF